MCQHVFRGKESYATPRQLAVLVGAENLQWDDHEGQMDWCLCCIDIPSTLNRAGIKWKPDRDPMFFNIEE